MGPPAQAYGSGSASPGVRVWVHFHLYKGVWVAGGEGSGWVGPPDPPPPEGGPKTWVVPKPGWVGAGRDPPPPGVLKKIPEPTPADLSLFENL